MRSINTKITLVLVVISLVGALFTAFYIQYRTQKAFFQFIRNQDQPVLAQALIEHYREHNSWEGADQVFREIYRFGEIRERSSEQRDFSIESPLKRGTSPFILTTKNGLIIAGSPDSSGYNPGDTLPHDKLQEGMKLESQGETIGWLVPAPLSSPRNSHQQSFLDTIKQGLIISSLVTLLTALALGGLLIRSFTRPLRKLAQATEAVAGGELGYQADIQSGDELGKLADSFNSMSSKLARTDHARKQMTADIAHDLRTPLSVLLGYTEALREGKLTGRQDIFHVMHQQAEHLNYLIDDLRTLSLLDAGEISLNEQTIDPAVLIQQNVAALNPLIQEKNLYLEAVGLDKGLPQLKADPERMSQALNNILNNAIRELSPGEKIKVSSRTEKNSLVIEIADNGPGIPKEDLPYIFDRFYRVDKSRQQDEGTSGLGLSIAKKLIEAQGGEISVDSEIDKGTIFTIKFPAA